MEVVTINKQVPLYIEKPIENIVNNYVPVDV
jgi:hypothetical protein